MSTLPSVSRPNLTMVEWPHRVPRTRTARGAGYGRDRPLTIVVVIAVLMTLGH